MTKLAAPFVARGSRSTTASAFNEGISVPKADWQREVAKDPALGSTDHAEKRDAMKRSILTGSLAKYRKR